MRKGRAGGWTMSVVLFAIPGLSFATSSSELSSPAINSRAVEDQVRHELTSLAYYSVLDDLSFRVEAGKFTLLGEVTQPVVKDDAERAVKKIPGVQAVLNQVEVLPLSRVDDQIRRHVYYAVYAYGPLGRYGAGLAAGNSDHREERARDPDRSSGEPDGSRPGVSARQHGARGVFGDESPADRGVEFQSSSPNPKQVWITWTQSSHALAGGTGWIHGGPLPPSGPPI